MRAVFLDRDGTINASVSFLRHPRQLRLLPGAARAIKKLKQAGFLVIVITNQGGVLGRGLATEKGLRNIHALLSKRLKRSGATIDAVYYCPHHPEADLAKYRARCRCRKPNTGLIKKAVKDFKVDIRRSFMVGDMTTDVLAGNRAGLTTILVRTGSGGRDKKSSVRPHFIARDLLRAAVFIKKHAK